MAIATKQTTKQTVVSVLLSGLGTGLFVMGFALTAEASEYIGVGLFLTEQNVFEDDAPAGNTVVRGTIPDSPAVDAGIMAGDVVTAVNGQSTVGLAAPEIIELIKAQADSTIELVLDRDGQTIEASVTRASIKEPESWIPLMNEQGELFSGLSAVVTPFVSGCPGTGLNPTFNDVSFLAPLPPAAQRRIVITNQRTGGYTDRAYDGARKRSESFDITLGERHSTRYLTVLPGENILSYKVLENGEEVGSASFLLSVRQEGPIGYWPYDAIGQQLCPNGLPRALPPASYQPAPYQPYVYQPYVYQPHSHNAWPYTPSLTVPNQVLREFLRPSEHVD